MEERLTPEELVEYLRSTGGTEVVSLGTLKNWRHVGEGPVYYKLGDKVVYYLSDVKEWEQRGRIDPTKKKRRK